MAGLNSFDIFCSKAHIASQFKQNNTSATTTNAIYDEEKNGGKVLNVQHRRGITVK